ncbi:MAG: hypothetical protein BJ554DRAFT_5647 [Olpidium bornovanus]|uniref:Uncharacterized protein n=1 Tax=Olpidium bornovanus TaxID=278681 RepID=A0A8H7ZZA4_9FUNG|nr:MAG: hypothetical protein BJ554DRAFT_5647 [Olpidium bornovanus]
MDALPAPSAVPFAQDVPSMPAHAQNFHFSPAAIDHVLRYSYHAAVDGDERTCWSSWKPPAAGDYFGLHFIMPRTWEFLTIPGGHGTSMLLDDGVAVEVSVDGINWVTWMCIYCRYAPHPQ